MANKVISIEMGFSITKLCELDYQAQNPKVYHSFVIETPEGVLAEDGTISFTEEFIKLCKAKMVEKGMKSKQVVFSISSSKIASREVKLPFVKESRLPLLIRANAGDYFPIDLSTYELAHIILGTEGNEDNKQYRLMILAAPTELLNSYRNFGKALGLEVVAIDYVANSVYNITNRGTVEGTDMIVKVDERSALVLILEDGRIVLSRNVPYGIDQAIFSIRNNKVFGAHLTYQEALELSRGKTCIHKSVDERATDSEGFGDAFSQEEISMARKEVTNSLSSFISGVARILDYWNSRNKESAAQKIYLTGLGGDFSGLSKLMTSEIGTKVKVLTTLKGISLNKDLKEVSFGEYITCIGAAINPVDFSDGKENEKKKGLGKTDYKKAGVAVLIGGILISIALAAVSIIPYNIQKSLNQNLQRQINELQPAYETYAEYKQTEANYLKMSTLDSMAESRLDDLRAFIEELEEKMPSTFRISSFRADTSGISIDVTVERTEEVAKTIQQLKSFDSLDFVDVTTVTVSEEEGVGERNIFSVEMRYKAKNETEVESMNEE